MDQEVHLPKSHFWVLKCHADILNFGMHLSGSSVLLSQNTRKLNPESHFNDL
jgi:hypothetical protein